MILFETLKEIKSKLIKIILDSNLLDDECMNMLGEFIQYSETIEKITISRNIITDKGIEILSEHLIGNITLKTLDISGNEGITDKSLPYLIDIAKKTSVTSMYIFNATLSKENQEELKKLVKIPIDEREIPIKSKSKSAAKISMYE